MVDSIRGVKSADKRLLNESQEHTIQKMIIAIMPHQLKLDYALWTRSAIKELILDNLRVHHLKIVKKWVEENSKKIELFYLPSYSPDRNLDEYLNCDLKYGLSEKPAPRTPVKLKENLEKHMNMLNKNTDRVNIL